MKISFHKYHGAGNDFILIDNRKSKWILDQKQVAFLCDRHFGIGADGLILLSESKDSDFGMTYFNSDGNESTLCGNGGRCITAFSKALGIVDETAKFTAVDGVHQSEVLQSHNSQYLIRLKMKDVIVTKPEIEDFIIDTGSPHYVVFKQNIEHIDILIEARIIRYNEHFAKEGINIDFVELMENHLFVRTYERGVEDETLSCGTGVTASVLAVATKMPDNPGFFYVKTKGGKLKVSFIQDGQSFTDIWLEGPVQFVFQGEIIVEK